MNRLKTIIKSLLSATALTITFAEPISKVACEDGTEFVTARVYELLGNYSFVAVVLFGTLYSFFSSRDLKKNDPLALFFSLCLLIGKSFKDTNSFAYLFGSLPNFILSVIYILGMTFILSELIPLFLKGYEKLAAKDDDEKPFLKGHAFRNSFLIILAFWTPAVILSYPGNLCYDVLGEIGMAMGDMPLTTHHPLLHILLVGFFVKLGGVLGSIRAGLFIYIVFQAVILALALASTIAWLYKEQKVSNRFLLVMLLIYCISPMYSNMVSTAIKDIPFMAAVVWYVVLLAEMYFHRERLKERRFVILFIAVSILTCLLRNNGLYMVALTGVVWIVNLWKSMDRKSGVKLALTLLVLPIVLAKLINGGMMLATGATSGSAIEALSLPLQQTGRYLQLYKDELTPEEIQVYNNTFVDLNEAASVYDPDLADPVKTYAYYGLEKGTLSLGAYLGTWFKDFFKHPVVYFEAFFAHVYGWFDPAVSNAPRYEVEESIFGTGLSTPQKILLFAYRFADRFTPLSMLQNVGFYIWLLLILVRYMRERKQGAILLTAPLVISLLICLASPCFYGHPRYAYPIMFLIPFMYGVIHRERK